MLLTCGWCVILSVNGKIKDNIKKGHVFLGMGVRY